MKRFIAGIAGGFLSAALLGGCGGISRQHPPGGQTEVKDLSIAFPGGPDDAQPVPPPCSGSLKCLQDDCGEGFQATTLVGKVFAPNGTLPIYNALVYVPDADPDKFTPGVTCDSCSAQATGKPIVTALTDPSGSFRLENVPHGDNIPLIIQMGRWRRRVTVPVTITPCTVTKLDPIRDVDIQRLPRKKSEGDIPQIAIATGTYDPVECLLRKLGIDDAEFSNSMGKGRVHIYREDGTDTNPPAFGAQTLYDDVDVMKKYDMIITPCSNSHGSAVQQANFAEYTDAGGRLFATDLMRTWVNQPAWAGNINWTPSMPPQPFTVDVDQTFPKGKAFAKWLVNVTASPVLGKLTVQQPYGRLKTVMKPVQKWLSGLDTNNAEAVIHFTFNTPIKPPPVDGGVGPQCGRVVYSSFHVSAGALNFGVPRVLPGACKDEPLTPDEKALAFMIFDLTACVQKDDEIPVPPIP